MPKVVTLISNNTNIGKTTTNINITAWMALLGKKVLLLDLDPKADATFYLGYGETKHNPDLKEIISEQFSLDMGILETQIKGLSLVPANKVTEDEISSFLDFFIENPFVLRDSIDFLEKDFDYIFIDVSGKYSEICKSALIASDIVIIAIKCDGEELETIPSLIEDIVEIKKEFNSWIELDGIMVTLYTESSLSRQIIIKAKERFGDLIFKTVIPRNMLIAEANNSHTPVALHDIKSFGAESYLRLAKEFIAHHEINV